MYPRDDLCSEINVCRRTLPLADNAGDSRSGGGHGHRMKADLETGSNLTGQGVSEDGDIVPRGPHATYRLREETFRLSFVLSSYPQWDECSLAAEHTVSAPSRRGAYSVIIYGRYMRKNLMDEKK